MKWTEDLEDKFNRALILVFKYYKLDISILKKSIISPHRISKGLYVLKISDFKMPEAEMMEPGMGIQTFYEIILRNKPYLAPFYAIYYDINVSKSQFKEINKIIKSIRRNKKN